MIKTICDPRRLIPYHFCVPERLVLSWPRAGDSVPLIPVLEIPPTLKLSDDLPASRVGDFILYNGHHRRMAALHAQVSDVAVAILEIDEDLFVNRGSEILLLSPPSGSIRDHQEMVYGQVRDHALEVLEAERELFLEEPFTRRQR